MEVKCSFCGALSDFQRRGTKPALMRMVFAVSDLVSVPFVRRVWSFFMVVFVLAAINSIAVLGVFYIYPDFLGSASRWRVTVCLHVQSVCDLCHLELSVIASSVNPVSWGLATRFLM